MIRTVCTVQKTMRSADFLVEHQTNVGGFLGLCLKTDNIGLIIWAPKSLRQFLDLVLKIKQIMICQLHHKTDRRMIQRGAHIKI
jgi:hypothetical protein